MRTLGMNYIPVLAGTYSTQPVASFSPWAQHLHLPSIQKFGWNFATKLLLFLVSGKSRMEKLRLCQISPAYPSWQWITIFIITWRSDEKCCCSTSHINCQWLGRRRCDRRPSVAENYIPHAEGHIWSIPSLWATIGSGQPAEIQYFLFFG